jgi:hypothetical protein
VTIDYRLQQAGSLIIPAWQVRLARTQSIDASPGSTKDNIPNRRRGGRRKRIVSACMVQREITQFSARLKVLVQLQYNIILQHKKEDFNLKSRCLLPLLLLVICGDGFGLYFLLNAQNLYVRRQLRSYIVR